MNHLSLSLSTAISTLNTLSGARNDATASETFKLAYDCAITLRNALDSIGAAPAGERLPKAEKPAKEPKAPRDPSTRGASDPVAVIAANREAVQALVDANTSTTQTVVAEVLYKLVSEAIPTVTLAQFRLAFGVAIKDGVITGVVGVRGRHGGYRRTV